MVNIMAFSNSLQSMSLITTLKKWHVLFDLTHSHFTLKSKYFYTCMILEVSSFEWYKNHFSLTHSRGEISGIGKQPASVVIRVHFPNYNSQLIVDPNNNTLIKCTQNCSFWEKTVFHDFWSKIKQRSHWHFCRA